MNIVVLAGNYYPYFSANGNCINNIINELKKEHNVIVIAEKNDFALEKYEDYNGVKIRRMNDFLTCFHKMCERNKKNAKNAIEEKFYNFLLQSKRCIFAAKGVMGLDAIDWRKVRKYKKELERVCGEIKVDLIIPVILPIESAIAATNFEKNNNEKIMAFQFDHFTEGVTINKFKIQGRLRFNRHIRIKKSILEKIDKVFILPQLKEFYDKEIFNEFKEKIILSEHPLCKEIIFDNSKNEKIYGNRINLVFTGTLIKKYRNPEYLFNIIYKSKIKDELCMHMYTGGDCGEILDKATKITNGVIKSYGFVPLKDALIAMRSADILISIGVTEGNQVSGKIFDYFATGKPIVHFYFKEDDPNLKYFKEYPLALCLKIDDGLIEKNCMEFSRFCKEYAGRMIEFDEVKNIFYYATPKYVTKQILSEII